MGAGKPFIFNGIELVNQVHWEGRRGNIIMTQVAVRRILIGVSLFLAAGLAVAQDSQPAPQNPSPGWRRIGDPAPAATMAPRPFWS